MFMRSRSGADSLGGMSDQSSIPGRVVVVGGGVAGLEALLALRAVAGDRVALTLVSQDDEFVDRPVTVAEPFGLTSAARHPLPELAAEAGAEFVRATVAGVDAAAHRLDSADGRSLEFDTLILAPGAQTRPPFENAITFGLEGSGQAIKEMLDRLRSGEARSVAFVAPAMTGWLLPLYELALMTAHELAGSNVDGVQLRLLTPEDRPLALFGSQSSQSVGRLLGAAGIEFIHASFAEDEWGGQIYGAIGQPISDYVVTLPLLRGPGLAGVPATEPGGFVPVDDCGRVEGLADVYAAGDAIQFPVKQGGLAAQQADAVAEQIAASYGAPVEPAPFRPVLRGQLFTGEEPLFIRSGVPGADPEIVGARYALWFPPTKVAGRYLAPYLFGHGADEEFGPRPEGFTDIDIPLTAATLPG
jgi:sulfide:quinone oxidoreductase